MNKPARNLFMFGGMSILGAMGAYSALYIYYRKPMVLKTVRTKGGAEIKVMGIRNWKFPGFDGLDETLWPVSPHTSRGVKIDSKINITGIEKECMELCSSWKYYEINHERFINNSPKWVAWHPNESFYAALKNFDESKRFEICKNILEETHLIHEGAHYLQRLKEDYGGKPSSRNDDEIGAHLAELIESQQPIALSRLESFTLLSCYAPGSYLNLLGDCESYKESGVSILSCLRNKISNSKVDKRKVIYRAPREEVAKAAKACFTERYGDYNPVSLEK